MGGSGLIMFPCSRNRFNSFLNRQVLKPGFLEVLKVLFSTLQVWSSGFISTLVLLRNGKHSLQTCYVTNDQGKGKVSYLEQQDCLLCQDSMMKTEKNCLQQLQPDQGYTQFFFCIEGNT